MQMARSELASAQFLDIVLRSISEGVLVLDSRGHVEIVNPAFDRIMDLPPDWQSDPNRVREVVAFLTAALGRADHAVTSEFTDGRSVALEIRAAGDLTVYTVRDVTQERRNGSRVARSERLLRETLDSIEASVVVYDRHDCFVMANKRYFELYPHLPDDGSLVGKSFEQMLRLTLAAKAHTDKEALDNPDQFVARRVGEPRVGVEREQLHPSGRWDLLRSRKTPSGNVVTLRVDITEHKRLQKALADARDELIEANRAKSRFLAAMSHELRTPLNAIIGFADILGSEVFGPIGSDRYRGYAVDIKDAGHHLLSLIGDILDLSKIEAGKMDLLDSAIELKPLLEREISLMRTEAAERGTVLRLDMAQTDCILRADRRLVAQMVLNLLSNALKFTRDGEVAIQVQTRSSGGIDIAVRDTGTGMSAAVIAQLGQPFYQAGPSDMTRPIGTGLGLSIVREMMKLHGGDVTIVSQEGLGTTVTLNFPDERTLPAAA